jgi:hypothetical protein
LSFAQSSFTLHSQGTRNLKLAVAGATKIKAKFIGPYEVVKKIGSVAYKLTLPEIMSRIHPVFHVSLLNPYLDGGRENVIPPPVVVNGEAWYIIEKVIDHRDFKNKKREFLVQWKGYGPEENTWVPDRELKHSDALREYLDKLQSVEAPAARMTSKKGKAGPKSSVK